MDTSLEDVIKELDMFDDLKAKFEALASDVEAAKAALEAATAPAPEVPADVVELSVSPLTSDVVAALEAKGYTVTPPAA